MLKRVLAVLLVSVLLLFTAACEQKDSGTNADDAKTKSSDSAMGRATEEELVNDVFGCLKNKGDYSEIADCFDKVLTTAFCLASDIPYSDKFDDYYLVVKDFEKGADYIAKTYPDFAEAFEKASGKPLAELYDETLDRCQRTFDSIETNFNEIKNGNELLWDGYDEGDICDEDLGIKKYGVLIDYDYDRDGSPAITGASLHYIEINGKYYGLLFGETLGGGKGA